MMNKTEYKAIGETLYTGELSNGLKIGVLPKPGWNSFYAVFGTKYGGAMRRFLFNGEYTDTPAGVAHFLEHKMFDMPEGDNALNILTANGAEPNAFTGQGMTCYYFRCTDKFEENLKLLLRFVSTPYFTEETVQKEQGIIGQEIQMYEDSPGSALFYNLLGLLYDHHPIRDKVAGTKDSIAEITADTLYSCHKVFYTPANMVLCVEGDVDPERIFEIASEILPSERADVPKADYGAEEDILPAGKYIEAEMAVSEKQFMLGAKLKRSPEGSKEKLKDRLTAALALQLMMGSSSPFYSRLYSEGIINRDFGFDAEWSAETGYIAAGGECAEPEKFMKEFLAETVRIADTGFDRDYYERNRKALIGARLRGLECFEDVCLSVAGGFMDGCLTLDTTEILEEITMDECKAWIVENLAEERLAVSVIKPLGSK